MTPRERTALRAALAAVRRAESGLLAVLGEKARDVAPEAAEPQSDFASAMTLQRAAGRLGVREERLRRAAARLGIGQRVLGRWLFTPTDIERLRAGYRAAETL